MRTTDLHVSTIMLARSEQEAALLKTSLHALSRHQLPVVVADGGSPQPVVDFVAQLDGVSLATPAARGLVPQVKASLLAAHEGGQKFILYTEPDKQSFFEDGLTDFIERAPDSEDVGLVIASRTQDSFATFPPQQRLAESAINLLTGQIVGQAGDYSYGPFLIHRKLVGLLDHMPDSIGWGWRHFFFALAKKMGLQVLLAPGHFVCPTDQRDEQEPERAHRMHQLKQNIDGLLSAARVDLQAA